MTNVRTRQFAASSGSCKHFIAFYKCLMGTHKIVVKETDVLMWPVKANGLCTCLMIYRKTKEWAQTEQLGHRSDCNVCSVCEGSGFDSRQSRLLCIPRSLFFLERSGVKTNSVYLSTRWKWLFSFTPRPMDIRRMTGKHKRPYWELNPGPSENVTCTICME